MEKIEEGLEFLIKHAKKAADLIKREQGPIRILAHYDADGLTSSAIIIKALIREKKSFHLSNIKQIRDDYIEGLKGSKYNLIIFLDFGSGSLDKIAELDDKDIIIVDHHQKQGEAGPRSILINPVDFGIGENISSSGISYILSRALNPANKDLSEIAIIGAIGDSQIGSIGSEWGLMGINKEILKDAISTKKIKVTKGLRIWGRNTRPIHKALEYSLDPYIPGVSGSESHAVQFLQEVGIPLKENGEWRKLSDLSIDEEKKLGSAIIAERIHSNQENPDWIFGDIYELLDKKEEFSNANEFTTMINACGKMGKQDIGIGLCLNDPTSIESVNTILSQYRRKLGEGINWVYSNPEAVIKKEYADYVLAKDNISEHIISNVISIISKNWNKVLFGLSDADDGVKISGRCSNKDVENGVNLKEVLEKAAKKFGCKGGGHKAAAGATIPKGKEEEFIKIAEILLSDMKKVSNIQKPVEKSIQPKLSEKSEVKEELNVKKAENKEEKTQEGKTNIDNNINTKKQPLEKVQSADEQQKSLISKKDINTQTDKEYGTAESKGTERGSLQEGDKSKSYSAKKVERKGLVQYFSS